MRRGSGATLLALLALLFAGGGSGEDDGRVWIASGASGGTYRSIYAPNLEARLRGSTILHRATSGSAENLDLLADDKVHFGFVQADVYAARLQRDPERYGSLRRLGRVAEECVYVAYRRDGPVRETSQLGELVGERPAEVAVGAPGGGASGTWDYVVLQKPELRASITHHVGDTVALKYLARGTFDAVVWVTDPSNLDHVMLRRVRDDPALGLMELSDPAFTAELPDGTRIYEPKRVQTGPRSEPVQTLCTHAMLLARGDVSAALLSQVGDPAGLARRRASGGD